MQLKFFTISAHDNGILEKELNIFLASHKVLEVIQNFSTTTNGAAWHICIKYINGSTINTGKTNRIKVDYKETLEPHIFEKFTKLRAIRKQIANDDAIPAYAVFTDEELASIAKMPELKKELLLSINGIGEKKVEKFGNRFIEILKQTGNDQTGRKLDATNS